MARKKYSTEEIIQHLRTLEIEQHEGGTMASAAKKIGVSYQTLLRWKKEFGGLEVNQAKKLKELELENARLKRLVADQALDLSILKEVSKGNF